MIGFEPALCDRPILTKGVMSRVSRPSWLEATGCSSPEMFLATGRPLPGTTTRTIGTGQDDTNVEAFFTTVEAVDPLTDDYVGSCEVDEEDNGGNASYSHVTMAGYTVTLTVASAYRWHTITGTGWPDCAASQGTGFHFFGNLTVGTSSDSGGIFELSHLLIGGQLLNNAGQDDLTVSHCGFYRAITMTDRNILCYGADVLFHNCWVWRPSSAGDPQAFAISGSATVAVKHCTFLGQVREYNGTLNLTNCRVLQMASEACLSGVTGVTDVVTEDATGSSGKINVSPHATLMRPFWSVTDGGKEFRAPDIHISKGILWTGPGGVVRKGDSLSGPTLIDIADSGTDIMWFGDRASFSMVTGESSPLAALRDGRTDRVLRRASDGSTTKYLTAMIAPYEANETYNGIYFKSDYAISSSGQRVLFFMGWTNVLNYYTWSVGIENNGGTKQWRIQHRSYGSEQWGGTYVPDQWYWLYVHWIADGSTSPCLELYVYDCTAGSWQNSGSPVATVAVSAANTVQANMVRLGSGVFDGSPGSGDLFFSHFCTAHTTDFCDMASAQEAPEDWGDATLYTGSSQGLGADTDGDERSSHDCGADERGWAAAALDRRPMMCQMI